MDVPDFKDLPTFPGGTSRGCAWDVWNKVHAAKTGRAGEKDGLGTLNHLTPAVVAAAGAEIQSGDRTALNWGLDSYEHQTLPRQRCHLNMIDGHAATGGLLLANDDDITINTQSSSQWDGLCHFAHQTARVYYNGWTHEQLRGRDRAGSMHVWSDAGGICGRGVLIDYAAYAAAHGIAFSHEQRHAITVADIEAVAKWEGVVFKPGDIFVLRTAWIPWHDDLHATDPAKLIAQEHHNIVGLEPSEDMAAFLWNHRFAAAAADNPALEAWLTPGMALHEYLLASMGCPIGELWDLESLSAMCAKNKRYTFFLASAPLNLQGAIASFANAVAIQ